MTEYKFALLLHLVGVVLYFSGLVLAAASFAAGRRRERPSEIAALLGLARTGVVLVAVGIVAVVVFGFWLVSVRDLEFGTGWLDASLALLVVSLVLGGIGGQAPKRARMLAVQLAEQGDERTPELDRLLRDPRATAMNHTAALASVAILVLMVWQP